MCEHQLHGTTLLPSDLGSALLQVSRSSLPFNFVMSIYNLSNWCNGTFSSPSQTSTLRRMWA